MFKTKQSLKKYIVTSLSLLALISFDSLLSIHQIKASSSNNQPMIIFYSNISNNSNANSNNGNSIPQNNSTNGNNNKYRDNSSHKANTYRPKSYEQRLKQRVTNFSKYRTQYHHPTINWNARDLGGYKTYHNYYVKPGRIYRGGNLHYVSNVGIRNMNRYHINKIIDLRSVNWRSGMRKLPDPGEYYNAKRGLKAIYYVYPTNTDAQKMAEKKHTAKQGEWYCYGSPFVNYKTARESYYNVFQTLLNNKKGATYFHCLEGHDRTGTTAALILAALGVRKSTIYNDFLLTEVYQKKYSYTSQIGEINHWYNTINHNYGNINRYLRKGVGLSKYQINKLRKMYLTKHLPKSYVTYP